MSISQRAQTNRERIQRQEPVEGHWRSPLFDLGYDTRDCFVAEGRAPVSTRTETEATLDLQ